MGLLLPSAGRIAAVSALVVGNAAFPQADLFSSCSQPSGRAVPVLAQLESTCSKFISAGELLWLR